MVESNESSFLKTAAKNCFIAGGLLGAAWGADALMRYVLRESDDYDDRYLVTTGDDHQIALYRYQPDREPVGSPVFLVHGLSSNHRNLAMDDTDGLAQYLRRKGYDCWAVELRGRLEESSPDGRWGFDEYVREDLPAAVNFITDRTGSDAVHWIGHSMGGMAYLAYAGAMGRSGDLKSGVTIGSPAFLSEPAWIRVLGQCYLDLPDTLRGWINGPAESLYNLAFRAIPSRLLFMVLIEKEITFEGLRVIANAIEDGLDPKIALQFIQWIATEEWTNRTGTVDYRAGLQRVTTPTLTVVGRRDPLCPDCETAGYELVGAPEKDCLVGEEAGDDDRPYDHISLVFGRRATDEIFPEIEDWLRKHD